MNNVNHVAFATVTSLAIVTTASLMASLSVTSTVAFVALAALTLVGAALSIASMTAYMAPTSVDGASYLKNVKSYSGYALVGTAQFVTQTFVLVFIQGIAHAIHDRTRRRFA